MKKVFVILVSMLYYSVLHSQYEHIDCIILIDAQLPTRVLSGQIIHSSDTVNFIYMPGDIMIRTEKMDILNSFHDTTIVTLNLNHTEFYKHQHKKNFNYKTSLSLGWLRRKGDFLILNITNFNKKKSIYYFDVLNSYWHMMYQWKKEYGNRKKVYKKIRKAIPDVYPLYRN